ncbi:MAG: hypothetical protein JXR76_11165 [Deltaproteobacteria bacterium]|nr:hypothetical protein [Deltaproteobacteria bacterium]
MTHKMKQRLFDLELCENQQKQINSLQPLLNQMRVPKMTSPCCAIPPQSENGSRHNDCCSPTSLEQPAFPSQKSVADIPCCGPCVIPKLTYISIAQTTENRISHISSKLSFGAITVNSGDGCAQAIINSVFSTSGGECDC